MELEDTLSERRRKQLAKRRTLADRAGSQPNRPDGSRRSGFAVLKENRREGMQLILPEGLTPDLHRSFRSRTWELAGAGGRPGTAPELGESPQRGLRELLADNRNRPSTGRPAAAKATNAPVWPEFQITKPSTSWKEDTAIRGMYNAAAPRRPKSSGWDAGRPAREGEAPQPRPETARAGSLRPRTPKERRARQRADMERHRARLDRSRRAASARGNPWIGRGRTIPKEMRMTALRKEEEPVGAGKGAAKESDAVLVPAGPAEEEEEVVVEEPERKGLCEEGASLLKQQWHNIMLDVLPLYEALAGMEGAEGFGGKKGPLGHVLGLLERSAKAAAIEGAACALASQPAAKREKALKGIRKLGYPYVAESVSRAMAEAASAVEGMADEGEDGQAVPGLLAGLEASDPFQQSAMLWSRARGVIRRCAGVSQLATAVEDAAQAKDDASGLVQESQNASMAVQDVIDNANLTLMVIEDTEYDCISDPWELRKGHIVTKYLEKFDESTRQRKGLLEMGKHMDRAMAARRVGKGEPEALPRRPSKLQADLRKLAGAAGVGALTLMGRQSRSA